MSSSLVPFSSPQQQQQQMQEETAGNSSSPTRFHRIKNVWNNHRKKRLIAQSEGQHKENNDKQDLILEAVATRPSTAITKIPKLRDRTPQPYTTISNNQGERAYAANYKSYSMQSRDEEEEDDFYFDDDHNGYSMEQDLSLSKSLSSSSLSPSSSSSSLVDEYDEEHHENNVEEVTATQVMTSDITPPHFSERLSFEDEFIQSCQRLSKLSLQHHHHAHDHQRNNEMNNEFINSFASADDDQERDFIIAAASSTEYPYYNDHHHELKELNDSINNKADNATKDLDAIDPITKEEATKEIDNLKERLQDIKERYFMYRAVQDACMEEHKIQVQQLTAQYQ